MALYLAHHPEGTVERLMYDHEADVVHDFMLTPNVTIIRVEGESVDVLNADTGDWEEAPTRYP